ncbi:Selenide water dikinase [Clostridium perfringens]|nr:Selenide water dikinase [Clostridium perfringens]MDG6883431.1 Selenide water dikinase [Clostridium perfringens]
MLSKLPKMNDKNLIVGIDTSDDAAVYKLNDEMATIQTLDFFTPIVDDPYTFGQIAAANSLSDVYAMGGKPIVALNIACFPNCLNMNILGEILRGGADKVLEAGAVIVGGHTVQDDEPKYGLSVTGIVHPNKVLKNYGAETGDILILTKPIGLGIINTAIKAKIASKEAYEKAVKVMAYLNKYAGEIITDYNITSCTDITGFSLIGHAYEMAEPSKKTFRIFKDAIPFIKEAKEYASMGLIPAGCYENKRYLEGKYLLKNVESWMEDILFDPQTSGGLLISCKEKDYIDILTRLENLEVESAVIGRVEDFNDAYIVVE